METTGALAIGWLIFLVPLIFVLLILAALVLLIIVLAKKGLSGKGKELNAQETRTIQEIHTGIKKMEERVEALETILLDKVGEDK